MKAWQRERMDALALALAPLTVEQEEQIKALCEAEKAFMRSRPEMKSESSLKKPMTEARNFLRALPLTVGVNSWHNPKEGIDEHIALKYLVWNTEEYAAMNAGTEKNRQERLKEGQKFLEDPDTIVERAAELLRSDRWANIGVGLAVVTGRRLQECLKEGEFFPRTKYSVAFKGQLKKHKDVILAPYEVPTLVEADAVLDAVARLRGLLDCSAIDGDRIGQMYGPDCAAVAESVFGGLVPARRNGSLYTQLFRAVYGRLAIFYYAPPTALDITYASHIYGHYWYVKATGEQKANYEATLHYMDYQIGNAVIKQHDGERQGVRLSWAGVEVLEFFKPKSEPVESITGKRSKKVQKTEPHTVKASKTGYSRYTPTQETKLLLDEIFTEIGAKKEDDVLSLLVNEYRKMQQVQGLLERYQTSVKELEDLFKDAAETAASDGPYQAEFKHATGVLAGEITERKEPSFLQLLMRTFLAGREKWQDYTSTTPLLYLRGVLGVRDDFLKSYKKRHEGKDYSRMSTATLRKTKTPEAALERYKRATDAAMAYNDAAALPEMRWYINPYLLTQLVGGRGEDAKKYIDSRPDVEEHHKKHNLTKGSNRHGDVKPGDRITVPDLPGGVSAEDAAAADESEETAAGVEV